MSNEYPDGYTPMTYDDHRAIFNARETFPDIELGLIYERAVLARLPKDTDEHGCAVCSEVYQVVGALWNGKDSNLSAVLDNLSASATGKKPPHDTLLPFMPDTAERDMLVAEIEDRVEYTVWLDNDTKALLRRIRAHLVGGGE